jgi:hypothetical protein
MNVRFVKIIGFAFLAVTWLPLSFFGGAHAGGFSSGSQIRERISVESAFIVPSPVQATQFHQFRLSSFQGWFSKKSSTDFIGSGYSCSRLEFGAPEIRLLPLAPSELLRPWQFTCRAALHPRAPCQV